MIFLSFYVRHVRTLDSKKTVAWWTPSQKGFRGWQLPYLASTGVLGLCRTDASHCVPCVEIGHSRGCTSQGSCPLASSRRETKSRTLSV
jgi:hypothetical protein